MTYPENLVPDSIAEFDSLLASWNTMHPTSTLRRDASHDKDNHPVLNGFQVQAWLHFEPGALACADGGCPGLFASMDRSASRYPNPLISLDPKYQVPVPVGFKLLRDSTPAERKVNGPGSIYYNTCSHCLRMFEGPKHTHTCNVCNPPA